MTMTRVIALSLPSLLLLLVTLGDPLTTRAAESTRYVVDTVIITVRAKPDGVSEVVHRLSSGDAVELSDQAQPPYVKIVMPNGRQGWVDGRYLGANRVARDQLESLATEYERLRQQHIESQDARTEAEESLVRLSDDYRRLSEELKKLRVSAAQPDELELRYEQLKERLTITETEAAVLQRRNKELQENADGIWFLIGAGVLGAGIMLGVAIPRVWRNRTSW